MSFFEFLYAKLCDCFGEVYIKSTIIVFDNASVHVSDRCRAYFKWKMLSVLTLPPYTPEQNYVEQVFKRLKTDLSKCDFIWGGLSISWAKQLWKWNKFFLIQLYKMLNISFGIHLISLLR